MMHDARPGPNRRTGPSPRRGNAPYVEDAGANGRVCGRYTDPIYTTLTREP